MLVVADRVATVGGGRTAEGLGRRVVVDPRDRRIAAHRDDQTQIAAGVLLLHADRRREVADAHARGGLDEGVSSQITVSEESPSCLQPGASTRAFGSATAHGVSAASTAPRSIMSIEPESYLRSELALATNRFDSLGEIARPVGQKIWSKNLNSPVHRRHLSQRHTEVLNTKERCLRFRLRLRTAQVAIFASTYVPQKTGPIPGTRLSTWSRRRRCATPNAQTTTSS